MKLWSFSLLIFFLFGCADTTLSMDAGNPKPVCQRFGCKYSLGTYPDNSATHKPTKDEKIRARQGLPAESGSENIYVSFPINF